MEDLKNGTFISYKLSKDSSKKLVEWVVEQGIKEIVDISEYHVPVTYTKTSLFSYKTKKEKILLDPSSFSVKVLENSLVVEVKSKEIQERHDYAKSLGATSTYSSFRPHITISSNAEVNLKLIKKLAPPDFTIVLEKESVKGLKGEFLIEDINPKKLEILLRAGLVKKNMIQRAIRALKDPKKSVTVPELRIILVGILDQVLKFIGNHKEIFLRLKNRLLKNEKENVYDCYNELIHEATVYTNEQTALKKRAITEEIPFSVLKEINENSSSSHEVYDKLKAFRKNS